MLGIRECPISRFLDKVAWMNNTKYLGFRYCDYYRDRAVSLLTIQLKNGFEIGTETTIKIHVKHFQPMRFPALKRFKYKQIEAKSHLYLKLAYS